jgi:hypothetical protein
MESILIQRGAPGMVEFPGSIERLQNGNTLIADGGDEIGYGSEVVEVDPLGNIVWNYSDQLRFVHSARTLKNGNILMTDTTNDRLLEVTRQKEIVMDSNNWGGGSGKLSDGSHLFYPNDAYELEDGNLLVTDRNNNRFLLVDRQGKVQWVFDEGIEHPHNAHPTQEGTILVCNSDNNCVIEVNWEKKRVWSYGDGSKEMLHWPRHAIRFHNGNTLITDSKNARLIEVTPKSEVVWLWGVDYFSKFYETQLLPNSHMLISDQQHHQVLEIDRFGNIVWLFRNYRTVGPIQPKLMNGFFKEMDDEELPKYWALARRHSEGGGKLLWDKKNKPYPCPGLEFDRHGFLYLQQTVAVKPGNFYTLAGEVRTENVKGSVSLMICFLDRYGGQMYDMGDIPQTDLFMGTNDWASCSAEARAPENSSCAELRLYINGPGLAWMRNIIFHMS